jgi:cell division septum initiation protein DivIVA
MSQDSEKLKALVNFKKKLEKQIEELGAEVKEATTTLEAVNSILLEKGFKRGDMKEVKASKKEAPPEVHVTVKEEAPTTPRAAETESVIPLKTMDDVPLAIIYVDKEALHVLPDESKNFSVNTPPFQPFLVERVLSKMQEKDNELVRNAQLTPDKMFAYNIVREGDLIREIVIRNVDEDRLRELKSSIRWTLEKMYEKTKS